MISITPLDTCREWVYIDGVVNVDTAKRSETDMLKTFKELKYLGVELAIGDTYYHRDDSCMMTADIITLTWFTDKASDNRIIDSFAWRAMDTLPDTARFKIEYNEQGTAWRPLLDQSAVTEQDLTTLDVTFGELDRATQLRLVNHVLDGGECDNYFNRKWVPARDQDNRLLCFCNDRKYRAVAKQPEQPTERETLEAKLHEQWVELNATMKRITEIK